MSVPDGPTELEAVRKSLTPSKLSDRDESSLKTSHSGLFFLYALALGLAVSHHSSLAEAETEAAAACEDVESLERRGRSQGPSIRQD